MNARRFMTPLRVVALAAALLLVQTSALVHSDFDDTHTTVETCALCVGLASLGAGNVSAPPHFDVAPQRADRFEHALVLGVARRADHRYARGPPPTS